MATNLDLSHAMRGKLISALKADAELADIVPPSRVFPQATPADLEWPFIKMGAPITTPLFIDGNDGSQYSAAVHCFTKKAAGVSDPERQAMEINAHIVRILNAMDVAVIGDGLTMDCTPRQSQVMQDEDADAFHGFVTFDANAS
jgi:hypothetical protein